MASCICYSPPFWYDDYDSQDIGIDETNNRNGEVSIKTCKKCGRKWLHYLVEYWFYKDTGRWYRGLIAENMEHSITAENAVTILDSLECRFEGGTYFDSDGRKSTGPVDVDL